MYFGTWIDAEGEFFDTAHFSDSLQKYPFQGGGCYLWARSKWITTSPLLP
jgi:DNA polymerase-3 subunit alpha/error-prone DNA polymerase